MSNETKQTINDMKIAAVAQIAALHDGTRNTSADSIRDMFGDMVEHFDWHPSGTLTAEDIDAIQLEKGVQLDRIRAFFGLDNCGY